MSDLKQDLNEILISAQTIQTYTDIVFQKIELRKVVSAIVEPTIIADENGIVFTSNAKACELFESETLIGKKVNDILKQELKSRHLKVLDDGEVKAYSIFTLGENNV